MEALQCIGSLFEYVKINLGPCRWSGKVMTCRWSKKMLDKIMSLRREDTMVVIILMGRPVSVCSHVDRGRGGSLPMAGPLDGIAFKVGSKCSISLNVFFQDNFLLFLLSVPGWLSTSSSSTESSFKGALRSHIWPIRNNLNNLVEKGTHCDLIWLFNLQPHRIQNFWYI